MSSIAETIKQNRSKLSAGSIRTYVSLIKSLGKGVGIEMNRNSIKDNVDKILDYTKDFTPKKRKTIFSALIVLLDDNSKDSSHSDLLDKLRLIIMKDSKNADQEDEKQELSDKQKEAWMSWDDIMKVYNSLKKEVQPLWKIDDLKKSAFMRLQDFVMLSCMLLIPPRRSLDWVDFKLRNIDTQKDNYLSGNKLIFNSYKTKRYYGRQEIDISKNPLKKILNDWSKINTSDHLLLDTTLNQPLNQTKLTIRLYNLFGKKVSVNMLRHIFITEKVLPDIPALQKLKETAEQMGHSVEEQMLYKKIKSTDDNKE